jgi:hypothetical protein
MVFQTVSQPVRSINLNLTTIDSDLSHHSDSQRAADGGLRSQLAAINEDVVALEKFIRASTRLQSEATAAFNQVCVCVRLYCIICVDRIIGFVNVCLPNFDIFLHSVVVTCDFDRHLSDAHSRIHIYLVFA